MNVLIIIPAYNEEKSLKRVVDHLIETCPQYDYLIINDGSKDQTQEICTENQYHVMNLPQNGGLTNAIRTGMQYALEHHYDAALQFDADGQHLPEYIDSMVACMEKTNCDIVIASRFKDVKMPPRMRTLGGKMIISAIRLTTGQRLTDPTSGMRLYGKRMIRLFAKNIHCSPEPDTIARLIQMGANVQEVQVEMADRTEGKSYLTPINASKYMVRMLSSILFFQRFRIKELMTENIDELYEEKLYASSGDIGGKHL